MSSRGNKIFLQHDGDRLYYDITDKISENLKDLHTEIKKDLPGIIRTVVATEIRDVVRDVVRSEIREADKTQEIVSENLKDLHTEIKRIYQRL